MLSVWLFPCCVLVRHVALTAVSFSCTNVCVYCEQPVCVCVCMLLFLQAGRHTRWGGGHIFRPRFSFLFLVCVCECACVYVCWCVSVWMSIFDKNLPCSSLAKSPVVG